MDVAKQKLSEKHYQRGVISNDWHSPRIDHAAFNLHVKACGLVEPQFYVLAGDGVDFKAVSHYESDWETRLAFQEHLDVIDAHISCLESALPEKCEKTWVVGNHEQWLAKYLQDLPAISTLRCLRWDNLLGLRKRGWKVIDGKTKKLPVIQMGGINITHGNYARKWSGSSVRAKMQATWCEWLVGHCHRLGDFHFTAGDRTFRGIENGCLCDFDIGLDYSIEDPDWQHGFTILTIDKKLNWARPTVIPIEKVPGKNFRRMMMLEGIYDEEII